MLGVLGARCWVLGGVPFVLHFRTFCLLLIQGIGRSHRLQPVIPHIIKHSSLNQTRFVSRLQEVIPSVSQFFKHLVLRWCKLFDIHPKLLSVHYLLLVLLI